MEQIPRHRNITTEEVFSMPRIEYLKWYLNETAASGLIDQESYSRLAAKLNSSETGREIAKRDIKAAGFFGLVALGGYIGSAIIPGLLITSGLGAVGSSFFAEESLRGLFNSRKIMREYSTELSDALSGVKKKRREKDDLVVPTKDEKAAADLIISHVSGSLPKSAKLQSIFGKAEAHDDDAIVFGDVTYTTGRPFLRRDVHRYFTISGSYTPSPEALTLLKPEITDRSRITDNLDTDNFFRSFPRYKFLFEFEVDATQKK